MVSKSKSPARPAFALLIAATIAVSFPMPVVAQGNEPLFELLDQAGDIRPATLVTGPVGPVGVGTPLTDDIDLVSLRIVSEDPERIVLFLEVADLAAIHRAADVQDYNSFEVRFAYPAGGMSYDITWVYLGIAHTPEANPDGLLGPTARMCVRNVDGGPSPPGTFGGCASQLVSLTIDLENSGFRLVIPKLSLLAMNPPMGENRPASWGREMPTGSDLTAWEGESESRSFGLSLAIVGLLVFASDRLPDDGPSQESFRTTQPTAQTLLRLAVSGRDDAAGTGSFPFLNVRAAGPPQVAVIPGQATKIPLDLVSRAPSKRLVNLTATVASESTGWKPTIAPTVEIQSATTRTLNLFINGSASLVHGDRAEVHVQGHSLGHPEEVAFLRLDAIATAQPAPGQPTLYLHTRQNESFGSTCSSEVLCPFESWSNTLENDDDADADGRVTSTSLGLSVGASSSTLLSAAFAMDTPLAEEAFMDPGLPVEASLVLESRVPLAATVSARLLLSYGDGAQACNPFAGCADSTLIGIGSTDVTLTASPAATDVSFFVNPEFSRVPAQAARFVIQVVVSTSDPGAAEANSLGGVALLTERSSITLPMAAPPPDVAASAFVGLHAMGEVEDFVNPGKTKLYTLALSNEGIAPDRISVSAAVDMESWAIEVRPGARYELAAGESVNVTVLVTAPQAAAEGERVTVTVTAQSINHTKQIASAQVFAIATAGVQLEDEAQAYQEDEQAAAKILQDEPQADSPGPAGLLVLAALLGVAWRRRVSKHHID